MSPFFTTGNTSRPGALTSVHAEGAITTASPSPAPPVASTSKVFAWLSTSTSSAPSAAASPRKLFTCSVTSGRNVFGSAPNFMQPKNCLPTSSGFVRSTLTYSVIDSAFSGCSALALALAQALSLSTNRNRSV